MKIAFLIPAIDAMGPNIFTLNLVASLSCFHDLECEVFHFDRGSKDIKQLAFPVKVTELDFSKKFDFEGFDIIHSTMPVPDLYIFKHKLFKKHLCVTSMHCFMKEDLYQRKGKVIGWFETLIWKIGLKKFDNIIVSSTAMKFYYQQNLSSHHLFTIIPYGIPELRQTQMDSGIVAKIQHLHAKYKVICGCGSLIKRKGFHQLISYLAHNHDAAVVLIGRGEQEQALKDLAQKIGVIDRVLFLGFIKDSYNYYPLMDAYCMCSNSEGFGLAMLEAMQMKIPVVCTNLDIYKDYFDSQKVGLFEFGNQKSFNVAADRVLANLTYYSKQSDILAKEVFSLENMGALHYKFYKQLYENNE